jgi:protein TonB
MESKKSERADSRKWVSPLFNLGLLCAVGAVLVAFEWKIEEERPLLDISEDKEKWEIDIIPITIQNPPTAPPPIVIPPVIKTIDDDIKIDDVFIIDNNMPENKPLVDVALEGPPIVDIGDEIIDFTEVKAEFQGGIEAWYKYLISNLTYPRQAQRMEIQGTVLVRFVINTDGTVQDVEVVRSIDPTLDKAAVDVILNSPAWKAAMHQGRPVRTRMTMPIKFKLN